MLPPITARQIIVRLWLISFLRLFVGIAVCEAQETRTPERDGWQLDFGKNLSYFQCEHRLTPAQLRESRSRTDRFLEGNSNADHKSVVRWLQLNLEYQAFLASGPNETDRLRDIASIASRLIAEIREYAIEQKPPTIRPAEWDSALQFIVLIENTLEPYAPALNVDVNREVEELLIQMLLPAGAADGQEKEEATAVSNIQALSEKTSGQIESVAKQAIAARIQAANSLRLMFGAKPEKEKQKLVQKRPNDSKAISWNKNNDWEETKKLIELVTSGADTDKGVFSLFLQLVSDPPVSSFSDGVLADKGAKLCLSPEDYPNNLKNVEGLDQLYGCDQETLHQLMLALNNQATRLSSAAEHDPRFADLDTKYSFDISASHVPRAPQLTVPTTDGNTKADRVFDELRQEIKELLKSEGSLTENVDSKIRESLAYVLWSHSVKFDRRDDAMTQVDKWLQKGADELVSTTEKEFPEADSDATKNESVPDVGETQDATELK